MAAFWCIINSRMFIAGATTVEELVQLSCMFLRNTVTTWYSQRRSTGDVSRIPDISGKVIGSPDAPKFKAKAMETYGVLLFLTDFFRQHQGRKPEFVTFLEAAEMLVEMIRLIREADPVLKHSELQDID